MNFRFSLHDFIPKNKEEEWDSNQKYLSRK